MLTKANISEAASIRVCHLR